MTIQVNSVLFSGKTKSGTSKPFNHSTITKNSEKYPDYNEFDGLLTSEMTRLKNGGVSPYQQQLRS